MSIAKKCDRCGVLYEHKWGETHNKHGIYKDCSPMSDINLDLCPKCQDELEMWLEERKETE